MGHPSGTHFAGNSSQDNTPTLWKYFPTPLYIAGSVNNKTSPHSHCFHIVGYFWPPLQGPVSVNNKDTLAGDPTSLLESQRMHDTPSRRSSQLHFGRQQQQKGYHHLEHLQEEDQLHLRRRRRRSSFISGGGVPALSWPSLS